MLLVVNQFVNVDRRYIRQVRAILHAWERYGLAAANKTYAEKFDKKSRFPGKSIPSIVQMVQGKIQYVGSIKGWDNTVYKKLRDNFNFLSPVKIRVSHDPWFANLENACWIIEDEEDIIQGTAFFLRNYGLVTCDHCVGLKPFIYHPSEPAKQYKVEVRSHNEIVDLAILAPIHFGEAYHLFARRFESEVQYGDEIALVGYPEYAPGKSLSIKEGQVQSFTIKSGIRRFSISAILVAGNSGGPVLDRANRVVGVAVSGVASLKATNSTQEHGVIPIDALAHLVLGTA